MTLHPQAVTALALWAQAQPVSDMDLDDLRRTRAEARASALAAPREDVARVEDLEAAGVPCRLYWPTRRDRSGCLVHLHGGGFVFGDLETHDAHCRMLSNRTGLAVLSVDYRLSPEHPYPAAVEDVDAVVAWLRDQGEEHGLDPSVLAVVGDSAGGNLALVAALRSPDTFAAAALVYPFIDPSLSGASYDGDPGALQRGEAAWLWRHYLPDRGLSAGEADPHTDPDVAPILSTRLGTLPPTLVIAAGHDALLEENRLLADRIVEQGGTVELRTFPGMVHGFWTNPALFDAAEDCHREVADHLARVLPAVGG